MSHNDLHQNKSVLWAYKKKLLGFTSHRKKRETKIKKEIRRGIREANTEDAFELFLSLHDIRYTYYKETEKILGQTFGMCVLQDFEAITPNILARTIETVEGGGLVVLLLKGMSSLKQLYTLTMDCHARFRTEAHDDVIARFNERFILSLGSCESCLVIDDELNVLPISSGKSVKPLPPPEKDSDAAKSPAQRELEEIKQSLQDTQPIGSLIKLARTRDQAKAVLTFVDAISEKTLRSTVSLTAARGRGKSAALGLAIAAAVSYGYANVFLTSPTPENLKTVFEFIFKGFDALGYQDHADYSIIQSTNPDFNKAIVRVNIYRNHRQTLQYIRPQDAHVLGQAELVVIDEAAAIPLPLVKKLMGPYLCFLSSTVSGYEGTGRSLSLKLVKQLREQSQASNGRSKTGIVELDRSSGRSTKDTDTSKLSAQGCPDPAQLDYYEGKFANLSEDLQSDVPRTMHRVTDTELAKSNLMEDDVKVRDMSQMPPLFAKLSERRPEKLDYLGVSYGLTQPLHRFWKRSNWLGAYTDDFHRRFLTLLSYAFRDLPSVLALSIEENAESGSRLNAENEPTALTAAEFDKLLSPYNLTPFDLKRLESYASGLLDYHAILDRLPVIADLYFTGRLRANVKLSSLQQAILLAVGLQRKDVDSAAKELTLQGSQLLAILIKISKKATEHFGKLVSGKIENELPAELGVSRQDATGMHEDEVIAERFEPLQTALQDELDEAGDEVLTEIRRKQRELIDALPLDQYEIEGDAAAWDDAEKMALKSSKSGHGKPTVSIKAKEKRKADSLGAEGESGTAKGDKANKRAKKYKDKPRKAC
ncbi:hypothetical protein P8C59_000247 [Phyllachora maydis]|uniref:RNA cytidine acetyltransferase n=1 Tax=Phyllachora maydis TaxID=1825666 RepID=A0AAD9MA28_9PEZI|nr:hypothetical protein P8C59_000247 [Phyllachora maydis]